MTPLLGQANHAQFFWVRETGPSFLFLRVTVTGANQLEYPCPVGTVACNPGPAVQSPPWDLTRITENDTPYESKL